MSAVDKVEGLLNSVASLPCSVTGIPSPRVQWHRLQSYITDDEKHRTLSDGTLEIRKLEHVDTGSYTCIASNRGGSDSKNVTVDVHCKLYLILMFILPDVAFISILDGPSFEQSPKDLKIIVGKNASFSCVATANPNPTINWTFGGHQLPGGNDRIGTSEGGGKLTISSVERDDAGSYTCNAHNNVNDQGNLVTKTITSTAKLVVIGKRKFFYALCQLQNIGNVVSYMCVVPAFIERGSRVIEGLLSRSAVLPCRVTGLPFPTVRWLHNGKLIDDSLSRKYNLFSNGSLQIFHLRKSDASDYQCVASNEGGKDSVTVSLDVHCKNSFTLYHSYCLMKFVV